MWSRGRLISKSITQALLANMPTTEIINSSDQVNEYSYQKPAISGFAFYHSVINLPVGRLILGWVKSTTAQMAGWATNQWIIGVPSTRPNPNQLVPGKATPNPRDIDYQNARCLEILGLWLAVTPWCTLQNHMMLGAKACAATDWEDICAGLFKHADTIPLGSVSQSASSADLFFKLPLSLCFSSFLGRLFNDTTNRPNVVAGIVNGASSAYQTRAGTSQKLETLRQVFKYCEWKKQRCHHSQ
jgi:hypothetical protein